MICLILELLEEKRTFVKIREEKVDFFHPNIAQLFSS